MRSRSTFECVKIFKIVIYGSRFGYAEIFIKIVETVKTNWDFQECSRLFKINQEMVTLSRLFEGLQVQKSGQIEKSQSRKMLKSTISWSRSRQSVKI